MTETSSSAKSATFWDIEIQYDSNSLALPRPSTCIWILLKLHPVFTNRPSVRMKPVNPRTETTYFWNCLPEWIILDPIGLVNSCGRLKPDIFLCQLHHKPGSRLKWKLCKFKMADNNVLLFWQVEKCWLKVLEVGKILPMYYRIVFVWASESKLDTPHRICVCSFSISRFVWT